MCIKEGRNSFPPPTVGQQITDGLPAILIPAIQLQTSVLCRQQVHFSCASLGQYMHTDEPLYGYPLSSFSSQLLPIERLTDSKACIISAHLWRTSCPYCWLMVTFFVCFQNIIYLFQLNSGSSEQICWVNTILVHYFVFIQLIVQVLLTKHKGHTV